MNYRHKKQKKEIVALMRDVLYAVYHLERFKEKYFGITYELYYAMTLVNNTKQTISDIASAMEIPLHKATRIVQRLQSKRLVKRTTSLKDKRVVYVSLTGEGKKCLAAIEDFCFDTAIHNLATASADECAMFIKLLSKIPDILAIPHYTPKEVKYAK